MLYGINSNVASLTVYPHSFYNRAFRKVQVLSENYKKMDDAFKDVCTLFGENPRSTDPSEFFGLFVNFVQMWKVGDTNNIAMAGKAGVADDTSHCITYFGSYIHVWFTAELPTFRILSYFYVNTHLCPLSGILLNLYGNLNS